MHMRMHMHMHMPCICACICIAHMHAVHVHVQALQQLGHSVAPAREARGFAVESMWHEAPCGMHKAYNYLPAAQLAHLLRGVERAYGHLAEEATEGALLPESMGAQSPIA